ncbi:MAG TPA: enoyl-CoA hydratase-related protein [Flavisolibacter sp.]|jgi:enoyl-CoA hydratase|nr:enoyl-CoA hydratase-related protein [Flavisolibacter sp.]
MYQTLATSLKNGIFTITINRPDKLNALNKDVISDLDKIVDEIESNTEIKGVILTGSGQKGFAAGADITEFLGLSGDEGKALARKGLIVFFKIEACSKPIIAAVNGFALGGGCELAMACHFRIASENAKFGQPEVNLGLIPGYGGTQRLVQLIGKGRAIELLLTGSMIDAQTALRYGLVNHVVPQEELLNKTTSILEMILTKAPLAVSHCIIAANAANTADGYEKESEGFGACFETYDMKEGTAAFLEKRKPNFRGN